MRLLLEAGADPNARTEPQPRLTDARAQAGSRPAIDNLLNMGGATPYAAAARLADHEAMRLLAEHGADARLATYANNTALTLAAGVVFTAGLRLQRPEPEILAAVQLALGHAWTRRRQRHGQTALTAPSTAPPQRHPHSSPPAPGPTSRTSSTARRSTWPAGFNQAPASSGGDRSAALCASRRRLVRPAASPSVAVRRCRTSGRVPANRRHDRAAGYPGAERATTPAAEGRLSMKTRRHAALVGALVLAALASGLLTGVAAAQGSRARRGSRDRQRARCGGEVASTASCSNATAPTCHNGRPADGRLSSMMWRSAKRTWRPTRAVGEMPRSSAAGTMRPAGAHGRTTIVPRLRVLAGDVARPRRRRCPNPGRPQLHRMNRAEYRNAIRDCWPSTRT